jgi:putative addiction module component (TIGR02574 family)
MIHVDHSRPRRLALAAQLLAVSPPTPRSHLVEIEGSGGWRPSRHPTRHPPGGGAGRRWIARLRPSSLPRPLPQGLPRPLPDPEGTPLWHPWLAPPASMGTHGDMLHVEHRWAASMGTHGDMLHVEHRWAALLETHGEVIHVDHRRPFPSAPPATLLPMTSPTPADLLEAALALPREERARLASRLLASLDAEDDGEATTAWATELEHRAADARSGQVSLEAWPDVSARLRQRWRDPDRSGRR